MATEKELAQLEQNLGITQPQQEAGASNDEIAQLEQDLGITKSPDQIDEEYNYIAGNADSWFSIVQDPNTGGYGIEVPDIDFSFAKFDEDEEDETPEKTTAIESLKNTWNNSLDQLSLVDDRFYWLSEQLFGDEDSLTFQEAEARISESEAAGGETLALEDIPDAFEEEGFIGGLAHAGAAVTNAVASFGTSAIEAYATGGAGLAVDMVSGSVRDYAKARAEEEGISIEEASRNLGAETIIPIGLGALSYSFEKAGIKGVASAIKGMAPSAKKALFNVINAAGKEGATELAQGVVESFNEGFAGKRSLDEAAENVGEFWREEALETFLQGAVGGGVTAGGGRSAKKAASQLRSNEAERAIIESTEEIAKIDEQLNDPNVSAEEKKLLKRARTNLKTRFKEAIKEPNKDIRKLTDEQLAEINKAGDRINKLNKELEDLPAITPDEVREILKKDTGERIKKDIDRINKIYSERSTTNIRHIDGTLKESRGADQVQQAYEEGDHGKFWQLAQEKYQPLVKSVARELWGGEARGEQFENFVEDITFGLDNDQSHSLIGLINSYDGTGSFAGWVDSQLRNRAKRVLDKTVKRQTASTDEFTAKTGKTVDVATEDAPVEIIAGTKAKRLTQRLGFKPETAEVVNNKVKDVLVGEKLVAPTKAGYNKNVRDRARKALYPTVKAELGKDTKADPQFTKNLIKNWNKYLKLIPNVSLAQSRHETAGWIDNPPTQKEFVDYFTGKGVESASARSNRREQLANLIAEGLFAESANEYLQDDTTIAKFALINEIENSPEAISQARVPFIERVAISENRINAPKGQLTREEGVTAADQMTSILNQAWKAQGHKVQSTTSKKIAIANLVMAEIFPNKLAAEAYLEDVNGFTFTKRNGTDFIYNDSSVGLATPIHEMGHVWSGFVLSNNPNLWGQVMTEIVKDPAILMRQDNRLINAGYYSKFGKQAQEFITTLYNQPERAQNLINKVVQNPGHFANEIQALDEIMAGAIEIHGKNQLKDEGNAITKALNKFWDYIGKLLAKVQGREIQDLTSGELLDLAVNDVLTGKPGSSFAEMNIPVGNAVFESSAGSYRSQLSESRPEKLEEQAVYDAFTAMKDALTEGRTVEQAIDKGYTLVSGHMSEAEFFKIVKKNLDQTNIDRAALQDSFDAGDQDPGTMSNIWNKLAGGKIEKLLEGRFDTQISRIVGGKKVKVDRPAGDTVEAKWARNREFFERNKDLYVKHFPKQFWKMLSIGNKESILSVEDAEYFAANAPESSATWDHDDAFSKIKSLREVTTSRKLGLADFAKSKEYNKMVDDNQQVIFEFGDAIQALFQAGVPKGDLAKLTKSLTNTGVGRTNIFRKAPRLTGYSEGVFDAAVKVPEHNPPAGYIAQFIFESAVKGKFNNEAKKAIKDKFNYWLVGKDLDPGTKGAGFSNLRDGITKGFDFLTDNPFIRYIATGGDITKIKDVNGNSVAEQYGVSRSFIKDAITLNSKALQDAIVKSVVSTERPLRQQLVDDIDVLLGGLEVLAKQAKERQREFAKLAKEEEIKQKEVQALQEAESKEESKWNNEIDKLIDKIQKIADYSSYSFGDHFIDSDIENVKVRREKDPGFVRKKHERKNTHRQWRTVVERRYSGKEGYNNLLKDLKRKNSFLNSQITESIDRNIPGSNFLIGSFFGTMLSTLPGAAFGDTAALTTGGLGLSTAIYQGLKSYKNALNSRSSIEAIRKSHSAVKGEISFEDWNKTLTNLKEIRKQKNQTPQLKASLKESRKGKDDQFNNIINKAKRLGVYVKGDENLDLFELPRVIARIKKAEKEIVDNAEAFKAKQEAKKEAEALKKKRLEEREEKAKLKEIENKRKEIVEKLEKRRKLIEDKLVNDLLIKKGKSPGAISNARARELGGKVDKTLGKRLAFWLPASAEDFKGLLYTVLPAGKQGEQTWEDLTNKILKPFAKANAQIDKKRNQLFTDIGNVLNNFKKNSDINLQDEVAPGLNMESAVRFYLHGLNPKFDREGLDKTKGLYDKAVAAVKSNPALQQLAEDVSQVVGAETNYVPFNELDFWGGNFKTDLANYINGQYRQEALAEWDNNVKRIFSSSNLDKLEAAYGTQWRKEFENSLQRQRSGKNRVPNQSVLTNRFQDWINGAVATTMFINLRSGFLQMLSAVNYINAPGNNMFKAAKNFANAPQFASDFMALINHDFLVDRRGGAKFDVSADEIAQLAHGKNFLTRTIGKLAQAGFTPTRWVDSIAIAAGGALYYRSQIDNGVSHEDAILAWQEISEEAQQSSRPDKISGLQASPIGRLIFAFANTPLQYARLTKRAAQDIYNRRGSDAHNLGKIAWYGATQGMIFAAIQNAILAGFAGDDEEEDKETTDRNLKFAIGSFIDSWLKGWGFPGAIAGTLRSTVGEIADQQSGEKRKDASKITEKILNISPPISAKFRDLTKAYRAWTYKQEIEKIKNLSLSHRENPALESVFTATTALTNFPVLEFALSAVNRVRDINDEQVNTIQALAILAGYNKKWQLGIDPSIEDKIKLKLDIAKGKIENIPNTIEDRLESINKKIEDIEDSPINRGQTGQANRDGTIDVEPGLSPLEREKTIKHEMEHVRQMEEEGLDYDDNNVYYKGRSHRRRDGKIRYANKWVPEGDPRLPWEAKAFAVEEQGDSPLKRNGDDDKWAEHYARLRKKGVSHAQANKWIARQEGGRQIGIDEGIAINKAGGSKFQSNEPSDDGFVDVTGYGVDQPTNSKFEAPGAKRPGVTSEARRQEALEYSRQQRAAHQQRVGQNQSGNRNTAHGNRIDGGGYADPQKAGPGARWVDDWYSHPETQRRFARYQGGTSQEVDQRIGHAASAGLSVENNPAGGYNAKYEPGRHHITVNEAHSGSGAYASLPHERVHASGFDERVGGQVANILGKPKDGSKYLAQPEEMYGNLTDIRVKLGLKPGQYVTPAMLNKAKNSKKFGEGLFKSFDSEKIRKALNTVADTEKPKKKKNLKDFYGKKETALTRKRKYSKSKRK